MSDNNVILFPKAKRFAPANNIEEIMEMVDTSRRDQIEFLIDETLSQLFGRCYVEGFDLSEDKCVYPTALLIDALRAALYKNTGFDHSLHEFAEEKYADGIGKPGQILKISVEDQDSVDY